MELILFFRSLATPFLDKVFFLITQLGSTKFYLIVVPVIYWCINRKAGYYIGMSSLAGGVITDLTKEAIGALRPFQVDPTIQVSESFLESAVGTGMPSGHAFNSMAFWTAAASKAKRSWFWAMSATLVFLIGFTRVYSGVHFPLQVLWGWAGGATTALLLALLFSISEKHFKGGLKDLGLVIAGLVLLAYSLIPSITAGSEDYVGLLGMVGGMSLGFYLHERFVRTLANGPILKQAIKLAIGFAGFIGLKTLADAGAQDYPALLLPLYFLLGLWPSVGATAMFKLLKLESINAK